MPNIIEITDFHAPELDIYARYTEGQLLNRHEPEKGIFIAESPLVIGRALDGGCQPISILVEDRQAEHQAKEIIRRCDQICKNIPVFTAPFEVLTELTGFKLTRGLLCAMHRPPHPSVEQVCQNARRVAVLENVVNPTNVGAIFRSAAALNMDAVLLTEGCSDPLYRRAVRVSMGTVFQVPWTFLKPGIDLTEQLHELGFRTAAMHCGMIPAGSMIRYWKNWKNWPWYWELRGKDWPQIPSQTAIIRSGFLCPTAWIP